jgi:hypothetical protein
LVNLLLFLFIIPYLGNCHPDTCALFIGGDNLSGFKAIEVENWIKEHTSIKKKFCHVFKKKKEKYV